ncbi:hypothetical protein, partial [Rhodococcus opacus]
MTGPTPVVAPVRLRGRRESSRDPETSESSPVPGLTNAAARRAKAAAEAPEAFDFGGFAYER